MIFDWVPNELLFPHTHAQTFTHDYICVYESVYVYMKVTLK